MTAVIIASARRFVAESLALVIGAGQGVSECVIATDEASFRRVHRGVAHQITLFDLDAPVDEIEGLVSAIDPARVSPRRFGFFDEFTARHAEAAFEMGVTVLFPLSSDPQQIIDKILHGSKELSVTPSEGLTLQQLERLTSLSTREVEVLQLLVSGRPTKVVAHLLGITPHTVNSHKRRIFEKLGVQNQAQAVVLATAGGLVNLDLS